MRITRWSTTAACALLFSAAGAGAGSRTYEAMSCRYTGADPTYGLDGGPYHSSRWSATTGSATVLYCPILKEADTFIDSAVVKVDGTGIVCGVYGRSYSGSTVVMEYEASSASTSLDETLEVTADVEGDYAYLTCSLPSAGAVREYTVVESL